MRWLGVLGCSVLCLLLPYSAIAASGLPSNQQLCREENLIGGTWKMVQFNETLPSYETSWVRDIPYHYLAFYPDHYYAFVATSTEMKTPAQLQDVLTWPQRGPHVLRYTLDSSGVLNLYIDKTINYSYRCVAVVKTAGDYEKYDLLLTGYAKDGKSTFFKLYRRWF